MSDSIITAFITGSITLIGVFIANGKTMAVVQNEIKHLTEEVHKHNNFAQRIPVIEEQIKVANHRIDDLERKA